MANFGLGDMRLVAPRDGWPNVKAADMAGKALPILDDAELFDTVREAIADCQYVLATTSRERAMNLPVVDAREAIAEAHQRIIRGEKVAILFGPERTGLENEEITVADAVVTIPVSPTYPSLNLGQAAVILGYEWFVQAGASQQPAAIGEEEVTATPRATKRVVRPFGDGARHYQFLAHSGQERNHVAQHSREPNAGQHDVAGSGHMARHRQGVARRKITKFSVRTFIKPSHNFWLGLL